MQIDYASVIPGARASMALDWPEIPSAVGWGSLLTDLGAVHAAALELITLIEHGHGNTLHAEGISWMIVVRYGRCFAASRGRGGVKLDAPNIAKRLPAHLTTLHNGLIARRNATFAHAGDQCPHGIHVHLMGDDSAPKLIATWAFSAPGRIIDPQQARLIADLTAAIRPIVEECQQRAAKTLEARIEREQPQLIAQLQARLGKFATPEQTAAALMAKLIG